MNRRRPASFLLALAVASALASGPAHQRAPDEPALERAARLRGLALAEMEEGRYAEALLLLDELASLLPDNILPPINRAICLFHLQRPEQAKEAIARARRLDPANPQLLFAAVEILAAAGLEAERDAALEEFAAAHPADPRPHFLTARERQREGRLAAAVEALERALESAPENLVLMTELLANATLAGKDETALDALDAIEDRLNGFDTQQAEYAELIRDAVDAGAVADAAPAAMVLRNLLRPTELYQIYRVPLTGGRAARSPLFPQLDFDPPLPPAFQGGLDIPLAFVEADSGRAGRVPPDVSATFRFRSPDRDRLMALGPEGVTELAFDGEPPGEPGILAPLPSGRVIAHDLDQDTRTDLAALDATRGLLFYRGLERGDFAAATIVGDLEPPADADLLAVDLDHDGDLDLLVHSPGGADTFLRNNGDGSWTERTEEIGLAAGTADVAVADLDEDGDLDLALARGDAGLRLLLNPIVGRFEDATDRLAATADGAARGILATDVDNDGRFDLVTWGEAGGRLLRNQGGFEPTALPGLGGWRWAEAADFDNDGDRDLAVLDGAGRLVLLRNRRGSWGVEPSEVAESEARRLLVGDFDDDGDLDLHAELARGAWRSWRNEGGNRNQWVRLGLRGKADNNSKNNTEGLHCRIEARVGDAYQALLGSGGVNHLGIGAKRQIDVLRVVWTNGIAQIWQQVSANRTLVEEQVLKGSCPFLYTWRGDRFRFHTDLMWRSPLGMYLADGSRGTHESARDWVLIPGEALQPAGDELWIQVTEELWEAVYIDRQSLLVVDHPRSTRLLVDERFAAGERPTEPPLHWLAEGRPPATAVDHRGREVSELLARVDGRYVDSLPLDRYQGLTRGHELRLGFGRLPRGERKRLLLRGWIFPTDSTINAALAQDSGRAPRPPRLELRRADGGWETLHESIGMPGGKSKAVIVELPAALEGDVELRLTTNLQIYWDSAEIALGDPRPAARIRRLEARRADLHYRGFSRLYRESPSGPHLFDYAMVSTTSPFRGMSGRLTRFGDVTDLLRRADSHSVVLGAGDEMTVRFPAASLGAPPPGWRRDYVLYTDGWVKDADLHTASSQTVAPLPYHGMTAYPDRPHRFPSDGAALDYLATYQSREVDDRPFRERLHGEPEPPGH